MRRAMLIPVFARLRPALDGPRRRWRRPFGLELTLPVLRPRSLPATPIARQYRAGCKRTLGIDLYRAAPLFLLLFIGWPTNNARADGADPLHAFFLSLQVVDAKTSSEQAGAKARIAWWGDSAIVSDGYTGRLRQVLQQRHGDGGPGFLHVAPTFKGYWHRKARIRSAGWRSKGVLFGRRGTKFGLGGVSALGYAGAQTTYRSKGSPFNGLVEVFYEGSPRGGDIALYTEPRHVAHKHTTRVATDTTDAVLRWTLPAPTKWVRVRSGGGGVIRVFGVVLEQKGPGLVLDTMGVVGLRGRRLLKNEPAHHIGQIRARRPDLLVVAFGGNERVDGMPQRRHRQDMVALMERLKRGAPTASCMFMAPLPHGKRRRGIIADPRLTKIFAAQRQAAEQLGCDFLNPSTLFGPDPDAVMRSFKTKRWISGDLAHLTNTGHREVGDALANWFANRYSDWKRTQAQLSSGVDSDPPSDAAP